MLAALILSNTPAYKINRSDVFVLALVNDTTECVIVVMSVEQTVIVAITNNDFSNFLVGKLAESEGRQISGCEELLQQTPKIKLAKSSLHGCPKN